MEKEKERHNLEQAPIKIDDHNELKNPGDKSLVQKKELETILDKLRNKELHYGRLGMALDKVPIEIKSMPEFQEEVKKAILERLTGLNHMAACYMAMKCPLPDSFYKSEELFSALRKAHIEAAIGNDPSGPNALWNTRKYMPAIPREFFFEIGKEWLNILLDRNDILSIIHYWGWKTLELPPDYLISKDIRSRLKMAITQQIKSGRFTLEIFKQNARDSRLPLDELLDETEKELFL